MEFMREKFFVNENLVINNLTFSNRKADILACICHGYTSKTISDLLGISINTINTHIKYMFKICDCYSRDQLVRFCQKFPEYRKLQERYDQIILFYEFDQIFKNLKKLRLKDKYVFHVYGRSRIEDSVLIKGLNASGVNFKISYTESVKIQEGSINRICLEKGDNSGILKEGNIVLFFNEGELSIPNNCNDKYLRHVNTLRSILSAEAKSILDSFEKNIHVAKEDFSKSIFTFSGSKSNIKTLYVLILTFVIVGYGIYETFYYLVKSGDVYSNITRVNEEQMIVRNVLLEKIDKSISDQKGIRYVVLTGVGGAGKTTLAKQYISKESFKIKWEINSETDQTISNSFFELAENIASTKERKEELLSAKSVPEISERRKRIFSFIVAILKKTDNWCLLFDNVDDIETIKAWLPNDSCGNGVVFITTRNNHIKHYNKFSKASSIEVGFLSKKEQFRLFCGILCNKSHSYLDQEKEIRTFLDKIPMLPLEVSAAAYYIKYTNSSFGDYLNNINSNCTGFYEVQMKISLENMDYGQTRFGIVVSNLKNILRQNEEFKDLLLLICLLDSQNISIDYLKRYKPHFVVDDFIYHLKKYSVVEVKNNAIFIHRSTQEIGLNYLLSKLDSKGIKEQLNNIVTMLTPYDLLCAKWYYSKQLMISPKNKMQSLPHIESLLKRIPSILHGKELDKLRNRLMLAQVYLYVDIRSTSFIKQLADEVLALNANNSYITDADTAVLLLQTTDSCFESSVGEESKKYAEQCISICRGHKDLSYLKAICLSYLARYYFFYVDKNLGRDYLNQAISILDTVENSDLLKLAYPHVYIQYGICYSGYYLDKEESIKSISLMQDALCKLGAGVWFHKQKSRPNIPNAFIVCELRFNMFKMYNTINEYEKALECADEISFLYDYEERSDTPLKLKRAIFNMQKGRTLLRLNRVHESYDCIDDAIKICLGIDPSNLSLLLAYIYKSEAAIRMGKYKEGYELSVLAMKQKENKHNYADLVDTICYYNMAISKYKERDISTSLDLFKDFLESARCFCNSNLIKEQFRALKSNGVFDFVNDITICLDKSKKIFKEIYSESHPFVSDYVYKN